MISRLASVAPVWAFVIVGIVLVAVFSPTDGYFVWLPLVLAVAIIGTFVMQLAILRKEGLFLRMAVSVTGSVVLLAVATAVLAPLAT